MNKQYKMIVLIITRVIVSDNNCTLTKSKGAIGSRVRAQLYDFQWWRYTKIGLGEAGILYTVLLTLETILLEAFSFGGGDYLGNEGSSSSGRIFRGIR